MTRLEGSSRGLSAHGATMAEARCLVDNVTPAEYKVAGVYIYSSIGWYDFQFFSCTTLSASLCPLSVFCLTRGNIVSFFRPDVMVTSKLDILEIFKTLLTFRALALRQREALHEFALTKG